MTLRAKHVRDLRVFVVNASLADNQGWSTLVSYPLLCQGEAEV
jgi:hypothetical protein